ncbi:MAG: histidine--tRNA ligase [Defluviitaleaceae bacterium]|nr:histidine--tRNA ligase [Defluviitaleaceae bacterium]
MNINTQPLSGFMELLPGEQAEFDRLKNLIEQTYNLFGFTSLDTPLIERSEILLAKGSSELDTQIYFVNNGLYAKEPNSIALRFDLTVPLARYVAEHNESLTFPFRRCHIGKVYRGERAQRGRFREFYQCDIDIIGKNKLSVYYDAELPSVIYQVFKRLNIGAFKIKISNRKIFNGLFEQFNITAPFSEVLRIIDKALKVTTEELVEEFTGLGLDNSQIENLLKFMEVRGSVEDVISRLAALNIQNALFEEGLSELKIVIQTLELLGVEKDYYEIDLGIVRGLDYYTGTVYETVLQDSRIGSVCSGGRYDDLASHYTKEKHPGVGISIGLSRLFWQLKEFGLLQNINKTIAQVVIVPNDSTNLPTAISVAAYLRNHSIKTDLLLEDMPIKRKFAYIDKLNVPHAIVVKTVNDTEVLSLQHKESDGSIKKQELTKEEILKQIL